MNDTKDAGGIVDVAGFSGARLARIDNFFNVEVARGMIPGAALLVERHGQTVVRRAWGHRNRAAGTPMTVDSIFRIHSMTKPLVSAVTLMLAGEGRLHLAQPIADFIPAFADVTLLEDGRRVAPERPPTVHDLLRHTAGLIYARGGGPVAPFYRESDIGAPDLTNEAFAARIARMPLAYHPGRVWAYSHATDVLGRIVELVAGRALGAVLRTRLIEPLGMADTGFHVPDPANHGRIAEAFPGDLPPDGRPYVDPRRERVFEGGGTGLVSTLDDYARFCRMILGGGKLDERVYLSPAMLALMTSDHIGPSTGIAKAPDFLAGPGFGFGLGFAVRTEAGAAPAPGSVGELNWSGMAGTYFWIDPKEDLFVVLMEQAPRQRLRHRPILKALVYDSLLGKAGLKAERKARKSA